MSNKILSGKLPRKKNRICITEIDLLLKKNIRKISD